MNEEFCRSTIRNIIALHTKIVKTPRARTPEEVKNNIKEFIDYLDWLKWGGEITDAFYKELVEQINKLDWDNMAQQRQELKRTLRR